MSYSELSPIYYVYQYLTEEGIPYYIGKGKRNRMHKKHTNVIMPPIERREYIKIGLTEESAINLEISLIRKYGRKIDGGILDNIKVNQWACTSGWKHSEKAKQTISAKNTGKHRTEEQKENYRKPKSSDHVEKIKNAVSNMWADPEYKKKRLGMLQEKHFAHKGKPWSTARREAHLNSKLLKDKQNDMA